MEEKLHAHCPLCLKVDSLAKLPADEFIWEFPHSIVTLGPWQFYQGYCIVVAKRHFHELFDLDRETRSAIIDEVALTAQAIHQVISPRKINYEWLGNQVPHMHWHLFPRQESDSNKLKAVWVELEQMENDPQKKIALEWASRGRAKLVHELRHELVQLTKME